MGDVVQFQTRRLGEVIARLFEHNPIYRAKMENAGVHPKDFRTIEDLSRFPFTTKEDLRRAYPLGFLSVPRSEVVRVHSSSGSLGNATLSAYSHADLVHWADVMKDCLADFGVTAADTVVITHGYGLFTGGLGVHYGAEKMGCLVVPTSSGQTQKQIELIRDLDATVLVGNPSYILKLSDEMARAKIPGKIRLCICGAEPWSESLRAQIEAAIGAPALDLYGISEVIGPGVASEHRERKGRLVVRENHFYPEIVDGELVISTLNKEAMPLLRYRTGDRTEWVAGPGPYRSIARLFGRMDEMIKVRGVAVYPSQIENILLRDGRLNGNYVIEITRPKHLDVVTVRAEEKSPGAANREALARALRSDLGLSVELEILAAGTLPVAEGKARRFFDRRS